MKIESWLANCPQCLEYRQKGRRGELEGPPYDLVYWTFSLIIGFGLIVCMNRTQTVRLGFGRGRSFADMRTAHKPE